MQLQTFTMWCGDWDTCRAFYVDFLRLPVYAEEAQQYCVVGVGGTSLCIDPAHGKPVTTGQLIFQVEDLDGLRARAGELGYVTLRDEPNSLTLEDPDRREVVLQRA